MTDQSTDSQRAVPLALAEPSVHVRPAWITGLTFGNMGMWMASLAALQFLLPAQLQDITPRHKFVALGVVSGLGAIASVLATPIAGALSDRTTPAYALGRLNGRRHRWTLIMALLGGICLAVQGYQTTVIGVAALWVLFSAFQNGEYASLSAAIPDHVPVRQRATVAGWVGMPQALGLVIGAFLLSDVATGIISGYVTLAVLFFVLVVPFVLLTQDHPLDPAHREPFSWRKLAGAFWISPRQYPDFGWAWVTRFLNSLAIGMGTLYLYYFIENRLHYVRLHPGQTVDDGLTIVIVIYAVCVVLTAIVGGVISDKIAKRKMIVTVAGLVMGVAALLLTFVESWDSLLLAAVLFGVGFGAYLSVDQALITQVLPAAADRAKDLGIINIAIVGPAAIAPAIATPIVVLGGYPLLFGATAIVAGLGSAFVWKIKSVS